jgi:redox-sensitive bicupin YhaK (pirin superfamily)
VAFKKYKRSNLMKRSIERVYSRHNQPHMVGDGFRVYDLIPIPGVPQRRISPFLSLGFNAETDFGPSDHVKGVGAHPHKGFETVTIAYKGSVAHHDSSGNSGVINPGDAQWMTAGAGILHKEYHEKEFSKKGGPFEMVQLWVNLPKKDKNTAPHYQFLPAERMGKAALPGGGGLVNVIAGDFKGTRGPARTYTAVNLFDIRLNKGGEATFDVPAAHNAALLVANGQVEVNGETAAEDNFVLFANDGEEITLKAPDEAVVLFLSGEPIDEPIVSYGPFVMNSQQEITQAIKDFQSGKFGTLA